MYISLTPIIIIIITDENLLYGILLWFSGCILLRNCKMLIVNNGAFFCLFVNLEHVNDPWPN